MATINGRQQVGHGVGGGHASIDNIAFSPGAWAGFVTDDLAFFANGSDAYIAGLYSLTTGTITRAVTDPSAPFYGWGFNHGFAGGGTWAGWLGGAGAGLFTSTGLHLPDAGLLGVGPNGELGYKPLYQSNGPTVCRERDGSEWQITPGHAADLQLLGERRAIWQEMNLIRVAGVPQPLQLGSAWWPHAHLIDGRWWVSYFSSVGGIILHPFDALTGVTIVPPGIDCWHTARANGTVVYFALFNSEAEQAGQLRKQFVDTATVPLVPLTPTPPEPQPEPPPAITITSYAPSAGLAPLKVTATWAQEPESGPVSTLSWQARAQSTTTWTTQGTRTPDVATFDYLFTDTGTYELRLVASGPGGEASTMKQRLVTVTSPTPTPIPPDPIPPEASMIYVDSGKPNLGAYPCEEVPGEGAGTIGLKLPNGKYLGLDLNDPQGPWREADGVGAWESFRKGPNALVMDVTWDGVRHTFIRPCVVL